MLICVSGFALKLLLFIAHRHQRVAYQKHNIHRTCHNKQITSVELDKLRSKLYNCKIDLWEFNVCDQDLEVQYKFGSHWNHVCDFPPLKMVFLIKRLVYIAIDKCNVSLAVLDEVRSNWNVRSLQLPLSSGYVLTFSPPELLLQSIMNHAYQRWMAELLQYLLRIEEKVVIPLLPTEIYVSYN